MRPGLRADNPLEALALVFGLVPAPLLQVHWGMAYARTVVVATRLGIFEALASGPRAAADLAEALGLSPLGTEALLDALNGFGLLRRKGQAPAVFSLTRASRRWLLAGSATSLRDAVLFMVDIWDQLGGLEEAVRQGHARDLHTAGLGPDFWERYMRGLASFARVGGLEIVRRVALPTPAARLLDLGGGHGVYAALFCRRYPGLSAEILDLPEAAVVGEKIQTEMGMADRVRYRPGDFHRDPLGEGYDAVLLFNVLHNAREPEARALVHKAAAALRPGGMLLVLDSEHRELNGDLSATAGFNELLFFLLTSARAWPEATMKGWMEQAGLARVRTRRLWFAPAVLISGVR